MTDNIKPLLDELSIKDTIHEIRGQKVILDFDLAKIYGYETKVLNQQVKRNIEKFPDDFMFQITKEELDYFLRSQNVTIEIDDSSRSQIVTMNIEDKSSNMFSYNKTRRGTNIKYTPYAFTEQGVYMLMTVLKGDYATRQSIALIRAFQLMKNYLIEEGTLSISATEAKLDNHERRLIKLEDKIDLFASSFANLDNGHYFISKNQRIEADLIYQELFSTAKESIVIVDNYLSIKTLNNLKNIKPNTELVLISDNVAKDKIKETELNDFTKDTGVSVLLIPNNGTFHDRYVLIDRLTNNKVIYHCGASEKDAGNAGTTIDRLEYPETYLKIINEMIEKSC